MRERQGADVVRGKGRLGRIEGGVDLFHEGEVLGRVYRPAQAALVLGLGQGGQGEALWVTVDEGRDVFAVVGVAGFAVGSLQDVRPKASTSRPCG